jgi:L-threonylcarbamoyladenylate synthase
MTALCLPFDDHAIAEAARQILSGAPVALPSETVYGLAGDATNARAVAAIYEAKGRPGFNPLIIHVADRAMAQGIAVFSDVAQRLADHFWPGPLTMVLPRMPGGGVCDLATAGLATVAVRMSSHPAMQAVIAATGRPLAAPSANRSGSISPTQAAHVLSTLGDRIALVVDAGATRDGLESTIVAPDVDRVRILRPGPITAQEIRAVSGLPVEGAGAERAIEAPGQLASHYCPVRALRLNAEQARPGEYLIGFGAMACQYNLSPTGDLVEAATRLFSALHAADASAGYDAIAMTPIPQTGIGVAINDRIARAAAR